MFDKILSEVIRFGTWVWIFESAPRCDDNHNEENFYLALKSKENPIKKDVDSPPSRQPFASRNILKLKPVHIVLKGFPKGSRER